MLQTIEIQIEQIGYKAHKDIGKSNSGFNGQPFVRFEQKIRKQVKN